MANLEIEKVSEVKPIQTNTEVDVDVDVEKAYGTFAYHSDLKTAPPRQTERGVLSKILISLLLSIAVVAAFTIFAQVGVTLVMWWWGA